jgi:hypothetical protein
VSQQQNSAEDDHDRKLTESNRERGLTHVREAQNQSSDDDDDDDDDDKIPAKPGQTDHFLEIEESQSPHGKEDHDIVEVNLNSAPNSDTDEGLLTKKNLSQHFDPSSMTSKSNDRLLQSVNNSPHTKSSHSTTHELIWLLICFLGIMASFVCYGLVRFLYAND